jgi:SAM-dependent methyltransferase
MMALAGVAATRYTVDAFDISLSALEIARRGVYPERALSHVSPDLRQACGVVEDRSVKVHTELRDRVNFERRNLAEAGVLGAEPKYHLILCRNLFIYFGVEARVNLAQSLAGALLPGGRLFLGTADRVEELNALFAPMRPAASFGFMARTEPFARVSRERRASAIPDELDVPVVARVRRMVPTAPAAVVTANELYLQAVELRLRGELGKAERRCRQSLYLAPNYLPALELLQALWDQQPNMRLRRALRDRILRNRISQNGEAIA